MIEIDYRNAKGWLKDGETELLFELARKVPVDGLILNIGIEYGKSLACLRAGNPDVHIVGVDLDISKAVSWYGCELIQADSHELVLDWNKRAKLDLIFVDGDHGELGVLLDAKFADFLPVGGHILFQDCWDWDEPGVVHRLCDGVNSAVDKWFAAKHEEFEELPSVDTTRVFKRVKTGEFENGKQPGVADSGRTDTDLREAGNTEQHIEPVARKPEIPRKSKNIVRG